MRRTFPVVLLLSLVAATLLLGCGSSDDPSSPAPVIGATVGVRGSLLSFDPESVTIQAGQAVRWVWMDSGHSVTAVGMSGGMPGCTPTGAFDSGLLNNGSVFEFQFNTPGTYAYACTAAGHCALFESAVVVVQ